MEFKLMEEERFLLKFFHILDHNRVLEGYPWAYHKKLLVLALVEAEDDPKLVDLSRCDFHIHVHGLPLGKMTKEMVSLLDGFCDPGLNTPYGNWLRAATPLSYRGRVGANSSVRGLSEHTSRPTFVSRSSLQSQSMMSPTRWGSSIFGNFESPPTDHTPKPVHTSLDAHLLAVQQKHQLMDEYSETKCTTSRIESVKRKFDMNGIGVPSSGKSGGLALLWSRHSAPTTVREWLDRACANTEWTHLFPNVSVKHEPMTCLDHAALIIRLSDIPEFRSRVARSWRFEAAWLQSAQCEKVVIDSWVSTVGNIWETGVTMQIACCQANLKHWSSTVFSRDKKRVNMLERKFESLLQATRTELERLAAHEETVWRQHNKVLWLREGDRNTWFFHRKASHRFRTNSITKIHREGGDWVTSEHEIQQCISSYFGTIYGSNRPSLDAISKGVEHFFEPSKMLV
ncbi:UNVERIFIED_CONTAM: hypothetical protein Slati_1208700 [Sesamum latifolium]|uniref:Uncharacterized protein n=1 Tax=Sesamum latifolium TaxID=2727402 RepID=A0AAW2XJC7_9LAMI